MWGCLVRLLAYAILPARLLAPGKNRNNALDNLPSECYYGFAR